MSLESTLRRELGIRFIDARELIVEARINLELDGYPTQEDRALVERTAINLFQQRSKKSQRELRCKNEHFAKMKSTLMTDDRSLASRSHHSIGRRSRHSNGDASVVSISTKSQRRRRMVDRLIGNKNID